MARATGLQLQTVCTAQAVQFGRGGRGEETLILGLV